MTYKAQVIRTDEKAEKFGKLAFEGTFNVASRDQIVAYMAEKARGCDTVGAFEVRIQEG